MTTPPAPFASLRFEDERSGFSLDFSTLGFARDDFESHEPSFSRAIQEMVELEAGSIANPDEGRRVGHYWLRHAAMAPDDLGRDVDTCVGDVLAFARDIASGECAPPAGGRFAHLLLIGIGGSALGPQLLSDALGEPGRGLSFAAFDNTDPDGMARTLASLDLARTLFVVISKSGGTKETRNGMLEAEAHCRANGLAFASQAVAVTGVDSELDRRATEQGWLARFPMWDWVGGRTSVTSAVGLLPGALCGLDVRGLLDGAAAMDASTRSTRLFENPAGLLAVSWFLAAGGTGAKDMVVLPYRDRLLLFGRYLQQLVMESLGKRVDRAGRTVHQGLSVYGNKGSTDQHAYVQQLRDGLDNFFVTFLRVLEDGNASNLEVEPGITSADYLQGFYLGTRAALTECGRSNATITMPRVDAHALGALIALFERTVGLYASMIDINAYHQPGVEAGKRAAGAALELRARILEALGDGPMHLNDLAQRLDADPDTCHLLLEHLAANHDRTQVHQGPDGWRKGAAGL